MQDDPDINETVLENIIPAAIAGDQKALNALQFCVWLTAVLNNISKKAERKFHIDAADLRDLTFDTLRRKIHTITNPNHRSWRVCLAGWCKRVCIRHALNIWRQRDKFEVPVNDNEGTNPTELPAGYREPKRRRRIVERYSSTTLTTEKEAESNELHKIVRAVIFTFSREDVGIVYLWAYGLKLREISTRTEIPLQTVNERLTKVEQAIVNEVAGTQNLETVQIRLSDLLKHHPERRDGLRDLVFSSLMLA